MSTPASWQFRPKRRWQPMGLDFVSASLCLCLCLSLCVSVWVGDCAQCERNNKAYALTSDKVKGRADGCCCLRALPRYAVQQKWNWSVSSLVPDRLLTRQQCPVPLVHSTRLHVYYLHIAAGYFPSSIWGTARQAGRQLKPLAARCRPLTYLDRALSFYVSRWAVGGVYWVTWYATRALQAVQTNNHPQLGV